MSIIKDVMKEKMKELEDKLTEELPKKLDDPGKLVRLTAISPPVHDSAVETIKFFSSEIDLIFSVILLI